MSGVSFVSTNAIIYNMVLPTAYEHINKFMHLIFVFKLLILEIYLSLLCTPKIGKEMIKCYFTKRICLEL